MTRVAPSALWLVCRLDERVAVELLAHRRAHGSGAAAVHDLDLGQPREVGVVDELPHGLARLVGALTA